MMDCLTFMIVMIDGVRVRLARRRIHRERGGGSTWPAWVGLERFAPPTASTTPLPLRSHLKIRVHLPVLQWWPSGVAETIYC